MTPAEMTPRELRRMQVVLASQDEAAPAAVEPERLKRVRTGIRDLVNLTEQVARADSPVPALAKAIPKGDLRIPSHEGPIAALYAGVAATGVARAALPGVSAATGKVELERNQTLMFARALQSAHTRGPTEDGPSPWRRLMHALIVLTSGHAEMTTGSIATFAWANGRTVNDWANSVGLSVTGARAMDVGLRDVDEKLEPTFWKALRDSGSWKEAQAVIEQSSKRAKNPIFPELEALSTAVTSQSRALLKPGELELLAWVEEVIGNMTAHMQHYLAERRPQAVA